MPTRMKPVRREIPVKCAEADKKEFERMKTYFYQPSTSPITSPLVVAPKATAPFIRICGDYRKINEYVKASNYPIPNVIHELHKVSKFKVFSDLDVANAFHEILLHPDTSKKLSVQTPWGQFEPMFLPEGVSPASGVLMQVMYEIFADYLEWVVVIFDNILVCAVDYDDAFDKLVKVVHRCRERNVSSSCPSQSLA
jgi:hypothetical protein